MKAALVSLNFDTGEMHYQPFDGDDCIDQAHNFKSILVNDFPGSFWAVVADDEACAARVAAYLVGGRTTGAVDLLDSSAKSALVAQPVNH